MKILFQDFETKSEVDLNVVELDNYVKHPSTRVLMLSWAVDDGPVQLWFPDTEPIPTEVKLAIFSETIKKAAHNASFERMVWQYVLPRSKYGIAPPGVNASEWIDTAVMARSLSLPGKLSDAGKAIGLGEDKTKMKEGRALIKLFCMPKVIRKRRKLEEWEVFLGPDKPVIEFNDEKSHPEEWKVFCEYCKRDTSSEREIYYLMAGLPMCDLDIAGYILDQEINDRGIPTNRQFAANALQMGLRDQAEHQAKLQALTGLENPNSVQQLLPWVNERGYPYGSLLKKLVDSALKTKPEGLTPEACEALTLRLQSGKNSFKKYEAILDMLSPDDRLRRQFLFLGAARTGRWSGLGVQVQNLPRPTIKGIEAAMKYIQACDYEGMKAYLQTEKGNPTVIDAVSSCIRSAFQATTGYTLAVSDLNAIENRVLGWVCNEPAILDVFKNGLDPYLDFASRLFEIPYADLERDYKAYKKASKAGIDPTEAQQKAADMRQLAKPAVLGAGYGLGGGQERPHPVTGDTFKSGLWGYAEGMGVKMKQEDAKKAVDVFRASYPGVPLFWKEIERACIAAIVTGRVTKVGVVIVDRKIRKNGQKILRIKLPSGRYLIYMNVRIETRVMKSTRMIEVEDGVWEPEDNEYEKDTIAYDGIGHGVAAVEGVHGWGKVYTYGGKLTENIVQAIARDILLYAMILASKLMKIVLHVHDEIGVEALKEQGKAMLEKLVECMSTTPPWAPGLPLGAEGYISDYYKKG